MNLQEFRTLYNNDPVFTIADQVNELKNKFQEEFKDYYKTKCKLKHATNKLGLMFYYIFIHNVGFKYFGSQNLNNKYGFLECSSFNYKKIDRNYKIFINYLNDNHFIFYPIKTRATGKIKFKSSINIVKPVRVDRDLIGNYSDKQLQLFCTYLIQQDSSDPEGVTSICNKTQFINANDTRKMVAQYYNNKNNIYTFKPLEVDKSLNNRIYKFDYKSLSIINKEYPNNSYNCFNTNNLYIYNKEKSHKVLVDKDFKASSSKKKSKDKLQTVALIEVSLVNNGMSASVNRCSDCSVLPISNYLFINNYMSALADCSSLLNINKSYLHINNNSLIMSYHYFNPMHISDNLSYAYHGANFDNLFTVNIQLIKNNKYNLLDAYKLIKLDVNKLFKLYNKRNKDEKEELIKIIRYYNSQTENEFNERINPRYFTWFHFIPSEARKAFTINNSYLTEAFDVHACSFVVMSKLLEKVEYSKLTDNKELINKWNNELKEFQNICKNKYIYAEIANYAGLDLVKNKKMIKQAAQTWLNMLDSTLSKTLKSTYIKKNDKEFYNSLMAVDSYFEGIFPLITKIFKAWGVEPKRKQSKLTKKDWNAENVVDRQVLVDKLDDKLKKKIEYSKTIWRDFQRVELHTISQKMCNYLFFTYGVTPVTVHDALYLSEKDLAYVSKYESIEQLFWYFINLKYYPEEQKFLKKKEKIHYVVDIKQIINNIKNLKGVGEPFIFSKKILSEIFIADNNETKFEFRLNFKQEKILYFMKILLIY